MALSTISASRERHNEEPLLSAAAHPNRFVLYPIQHDDLWRMYKKAESAFWTAEEVDLTKDVDDWNHRLSDDERYFIQRVLAFFAASDGIVNENLASRFYREVMPPEAKAFYGFQISMEQIHCVAGDTLILTDQGQMRIADLVDRSVAVWNGNEFSVVRVRYTGDAPLYAVHLSNGVELSCTPNHKWYVRDDKDRRIVVYSQDLRPGDVIDPFRLPVIDVQDPEPMFDPYLHGFACGRTRAPFEDLLIVRDPQERRVLAYRGFRGTILPTADAMVIELATALSHPPHTFVPVNHSIHTRLRWLEGLADGDRDHHGRKTLVFHHPCEAFLSDVQALLQTLGVQASFKRDRSSVHVCRSGVRDLARMGFQPQIVALEMEEDDAIYGPMPIHVESVQLLSDGAFYPTFCFEEPRRHSGVFNGVLTGQSEMYSLMIDTFVKDSAEKKDLFEGIDTIPSVRRKADWALRWIEDREAPFAMRLLAFAIVEGIFFSGAFCGIFWLKERGLMPGLTTSNEFISRDEGLHTEFAVMLFTKHLVHKLPQSAVHEVVREAVDIEVEFITESLPCRLIGMNADLMTEYIRFVADRLLTQLGYDKLFGARNPFPFMARIALDHKTNFFEGRESNYAKANVDVGRPEDGGVGSDKFRFITDAAF